MNNYFVILAAGKGKRFHKKIPKQFYIYKKREIIDHSVDKSLNSQLFKKILIVTNNLNHFKKKKYPKSVSIIRGGKERSDSSINALKYLKKYNPKNVFIHDAARPNFSIKLLKNLAKKLRNNKAVIPVVNPKDSIKYKSKNQIFNLERNNLILTQTPQAFRFKELYNLAMEEKNKITDEATLFIKKDHKIKFIKGEIQNNKITYLDDIKSSKTFFGLGFDIHRLVRGKKLYLGGIRIPYHSGLEGHSDGDVILHAITDAILGAIVKKDIGTYFPNTKKFKNIRSPRMLEPIIDAILGSIRKKDIGAYFPNTKKFKNIRSTKLLKPILEMLDQTNFYINNLDINLICQKPRVSKYRNRIVESISRLMNLNKDLINLKGKTVEKLGLIGKEKAIACEVIVSIAKYD